MGEGQRLPMIRNRLLLCLAARQADVSPALRDALIAEAQEAVGRITSDDAAYRVSIAVPRTPAPSAPTQYDSVLDVGLSNGVMLGGISVVLEISAPESASLDELAQSVKGIASRLGDRIVADRSKAIVGTDVVILDGGGEFQLVYCMPRSSGVSHEDFCRFWAEEHTKVSVFTPGLAGYRQLHTSLPHSQSAAIAAGVAVTEIDGVALEWFATVDDFTSAVGAPAEFRESAKSSEEQFNNLNGVSAILTSVIDCGRDTCTAPW
jgi:hypothetical protein